MLLSQSNGTCLNIRLHTSVQFRYYTISVATAKTWLNAFIPEQPALRTNELRECYAQDNMERDPLDLRAQVSDDPF